MITGQTQLTVTKQPVDEANPKKLGKDSSIVSGTRRYCSVSSYRRYWSPMILYHELIALLQASVAPPYNHYKPSKYFIRLSCIRTKLSRRYHYISVWWLTAVLFRGWKTSPEKWQRLTVTGRWACFFFSFRSTVCKSGFISKATKLSLSPSVSWFYRCHITGRPEIIFLSIPNETDIKTVASACVVKF